MQVIVRDCEGFVLQRKEGGSSEVCISPVLGKVGFGGSVLVTDSLKTIKKKSWWVYPEGGGEPRKHCVVPLCACLDVFITSLSKCFDRDR